MEQSIGRKPVIFKWTRSPVGLLGSRERSFGIPATRVVLSKQLEAGSAAPMPSKDCTILILASRARCKDLMSVTMRLVYDIRKIFNLGPEGIPPSLILSCFFLPGLLRFLASLDGLFGGVIALLCTTKCYSRYHCVLQN